MVKHVSVYISHKTLLVQLGQQILIFLLGLDTRQSSLLGLVLLAILKLTSLKIVAEFWNLCIVRHAKTYLAHLLSSTANYLLALVPS